MHVISDVCLAGQGGAWIAGSGKVRGVRALRFLSDDGHAAEPYYPIKHLCLASLQTPLAVNESGQFLNFSP